MNRRPRLMRTTAVVAAALATCASCGIHAVRPWVYLHEDSTSTSSYAYGISGTVDGGCVFAGRIFSAGDDEADLLAVRLDRHGREIWKRAFGVVGLTEEGYDAVEMPDGRIAVVGVRAEGTDLDTDDSWVLMLDCDGKVIWNRAYPLECYDLAVCVEPRAGGGLIVACEVEEPDGSGNNDIRVMALDDRGDLVWEQRQSTEEWDDPGSLSSTADGGCILLATTGPMDQSTSDMWLVRLDGSGRTLFEKRYDSGRPDEGNAVCPDGEGGYFLAGTSGIIQADDLDIWLMKVAADGVENWARRYGRRLDDAVAAVAAAPDGGAVIAGRVGGGMGAMLLDSEGSTVWRVTLGLESVDGICALTGGGWAVCGSLEEAAAVIVLSPEGTAVEGFANAAD
jgi:hypothetical protein